MTHYARINPANGEFLGFYDDRRKNKHKEYSFIEVTDSEFEQATTTNCTLSINMVKGELIITPYVMSDEEALKTLRAIRDAKLLESDWTQLPDALASMSQEKQKQWKEYRQALRDITELYTSPKKVVWPVSPKEKEGG